MKLERVSYSAIDSWKNCPYRFEKIYGANRLYTETEPLVLGNIMHEALYELYEPGNLDTLDEIFHRIWVKKGYMDSKLYKEGQKMVDYYINNHLTKNEIIAREVKFSVDVGLGIPVVGVIDRIDRLSTGNGDFEYEIVDYKTGNYIKNYDEVENDMQLSIYDWAFRKMWEQGSFKGMPEPIDVKLSLLYLRSNKISTYRTEDDRALVEDMIKATIEDIIATDHPKPKLNNFCGWCVVNKDCPMYQQLLRMSPSVDDVHRLDDDELLSTYKEMQQREKVVQGYKDELNQEILHRLEQSEASSIETSSFNAYIYTKSYRHYNPKIIRELLEPIGVYEDVLKVDNKALQQVIKSNHIPDSMLEGAFHTTSSKPIVTIKAIK